MKSYTDLEQSKKLAEFLPLESADMWYHGHGSPWESEREYDDDACPFHSMRPNWDKPSWSLVALLNVINDDYYTTLYHDGVAWNVEAIHHDNVKDKHNTYANTQVDACYDLILKIKNSSI